MKKMVVTFLAISLALVPYAASVNAQNSTALRPPVEQPLVREGDFAVELATALNLTRSHDEAAAENSLAAINIAPRNGWISDYPVTPDIVAEVKESTARSASAGSLNMPEADAARTVDGVSTAMNLPIKVGEGYASSSSSSSSYEYSAGSIASAPEVPSYMEPSEVEQYYDDNGPPIVSYYSPPWDYAYLYDWVPYPFWWGGWGFGGFFVLGDFDRGHGHHRFTNHVSHANGTVSRIDPATRGTSASSRVAGANGTGQGSRLSSPNAQAGARAIMNRSTGTAAGATAGNTANASASRNLGSSGSSRNMDRSPSYSGRSFSSAPSSRSFSSGSSGGGYRSGFSGGGGFGGGGFHGGGGFGGGGFGGGGHGGGGGHR